jgi:hypothetical protein
LFLLITGTWRRLCRISDQEPFGGRRGEFARNPLVPIPAYVILAGAIVRLEFEPAILRAEREHLEDI